MTLQETELLKQLVRTESVNPAFTTDGSGGEGPVTDFLQGLLEDLGVQWLRQTVLPGRDNLVAVLPGNPSDVMLWEVHQDTVGIAGMTIDPFGGEEREGRIWGRGACDIKGGMAAMLTAFARAKAVEDRQGPTIVLGMSINEECGFTGAAALSQLWSNDESVVIDPKTVTGTLTVDELRRLRPQRAIVAEPTLLDVVVAHRGVVRWKCHTRGLAAHSSQPERGCNAIYAIGEVARAFEDYHLEQLCQREPHSRCGKPTVCVSMIEGGSGVNTVPDHAVIDIDRRLIPGEAPEAAYEHLTTYVNQRVQREGIQVEHEQPWIGSQGLSDENNQAWAEQIATVSQGLDLPSQLIGVPYGTDAPAIVADDIPTVVFGPGSIDQAHTKDEWLAIDQLEKATEVFFRLACGE
jgi:acetylornithine deacetylase/succinyl-diaminopimelate desuccinylase-like protein